MSWGLKVKDRDLISFLSAVLYYAEKGHPLPVAFKRAKCEHKIKNVNYNEVFSLAYKLTFSYNSLTGRGRKDKVRNFLSYGGTPILPNWITEELKRVNIDVDKVVHGGAQWIRVNTLKGDIDKVRKELEKAIDVFDSPLPYVFRVKERVPSEFTRSYKVLYQDLASAYVVESLKPQQGEVLLDFASSPGIKVSQYMALTENRGRVIATDVDHNRLRKELLLLRKMGVDLNRVEVINQDSSRSAIMRGDKALIDAPCSSTGIITKEPTLMIRLNQRHLISRLSKLQKSIINKAVKATEKIVYSTCSILPEEGEEVISEYEKRLETLNIDGNTGYEIYPFHDKVRRFFPGINHTDGFFIARLRIS
ncbi:rRNA cytosine-C5-methyltransferase [Sulfolobales archaeon HS-7]|nr:rRNA cytosine-C5-methyltransferase [Sulfolobales archaeon HS-7]